MFCQVDQPLGLTSGGLVFSTAQGYGFDMSKETRESFIKSLLEIFEEEERTPVPPPAPVTYHPRRVAATFEESTLVGGQVMMTHAKGTCYGYWCSVHYNSPHHMRSWPQEWVDSKMWRTCGHGQLHPDPDDYNHMMDKIPHHPHEDCDGCCQRPFDNEGLI
jgi:hypothetical protein